MKAIAAALVLLAVLAMAEARPTMRVLNKKSTSATATSAAISKDGGSAWAGSEAAAKDGGQANADSLAYADGPNATADSNAVSYAADWGKADSQSTAVAKGKGAKADSDAKAYAEGEVTAVAVSDAVAINDAKAAASAHASGEATAKASAVAIGEDDDDDGKDKHTYYPHHYYHYYTADDDDDGDEKHTYDPFYYYYYGYHGYKTVDPSAKYPYKGHYVVVDKEEADDEELTPVKYVDPAILAYYAQHIYNYGCFEGKYCRCTYDESCGECPYGYFCGSKKEEVCEDVEVWAKKCDPKPTKKCVPDLTACGSGFCKYDEKCVADYYWCHAKWCTPRYSCVAVDTPKKCVWELKDGKKVQVCTDFTPEACVAGQDPCAIGYKCSEDPCTFVKSTVKKCEEKDVPVCIAFDIPIYKTLFKKCGPGYCHPGYKCEIFDHDSCVAKVEVVHPVIYKPIVDPEDDDGDDDEEGSIYVPYEPHYPHVDKDKKDSSASVTATAKAVSTPDGVVSATKVDASVTGDGVASGNADATATNGDDKATSWSGVDVAKGEASAATKTDAKGDAIALGEAKGVANESDK